MFVAIYISKFESLSMEIKSINHSNMISLANLVNALKLLKFSKVSKLRYNYNVGKRNMRVKGKFPQKQNNVRIMTKVRESGMIFPVRYHPCCHQIMIFH